MAAEKREELLNLIPAYAIGALDEQERIDFEAWLQTDPEAQAILADYQIVADHLVALAPLRPAPAHLQADLRQRLTAGSGDARSQRVLRRGILWIVAAAAVLLLAAVLGAIVLVREK